MQPSLPRIAEDLTSGGDTTPSALAFATEAAAPHRPGLHFTPERNWLSDPNGLVFLEGEYHLFYQYNPEGDKWGHMSWGHAVSTDLLHWEHLPLALAESDEIMIFSGSAVVDWKDTSGFGSEGHPALVAIYTGHRPGAQDQRLAFSNDMGRSWKQYAGNPVLDLGLADFRDPKVFWHDVTLRWVMVVSLAVERKIALYGSPDLKSWTRLSEFGPAGSTEGIGECPDLFELPVEGESATRKWVLVVNVNPGGPAGGSGCQYFVGEFDGTTFKTDYVDTRNIGGIQGSERSDAPILWADFGPDFYAATSWSDIPRADGRRIWLAWMSNWMYANELPTRPWRGTMTVPRTLGLRRTPEGLRLMQQPIIELNGLRKTPPRTFTGGSFQDATIWLEGQSGLHDLLDVTFEFSKLSPGSAFKVSLTSGTGERTFIKCDASAPKLKLDRTLSGRRDFHAEFAGWYEAPLHIEHARLALRLLIDRSSIEILTGDGLTSMTALVFPSPGGRTLGLEPEGVTLPRVNSIVIHSLEP